MRTTAEFQVEIAALSLALASCAGAPREQLPEVVRMDEEDRARYEETIEALQAELAASSAAIARLEERVVDQELGIAAVDGGSAPEARARAELHACRADLERYQAGLREAVSELNRAATRRLQPPIPHGAAPREYGHVHSATPQVRVSMTDVRVEGRLYSTRDTDSRTTVVIRLMEDERQVDVERVPVVVGAHGAREYSVTFERSPSSTASYTAEVTLEEF